MSTQAKAPQGGTAAPKGFKQKSFIEKCIHVGKAALCLLTFGFAFPHIFTGE